MLTGSSLSIKAQYNDPAIPKPSNGYGADGNHTIQVITFSNPNFTNKNIEIYYPGDLTTKVPTIFYSHAYGGNISANISGMLNFVARKGYAIVYVPYQTTGVTVQDRYTNLLQGFRLAARTYPNIIDTTWVGFMGHSFGGGASFGLAYTCFTENNWGVNGRFIYALAQWYSYNISQDNLKNFPTNTKLLTEIFDDDTTNDHRMAIDIFRNISIPEADKDFICLKSDTINNYIYLADHVVPNTSAAFNALDYYAYYRFIDALCDYTFNNNPDGKLVALGHGSTEQITMPGSLKPLAETLAPTPKYEESKYLFPCDDTQNLRQSYCTPTTDLHSTAIENSVPIFGYNQQENSIVLKEEFSGKAINIYNLQGEKVAIFYGKKYAGTNLKLPKISAGLYIILCENSCSKFIRF
jgi:dienelactone hydrolase